MRPEPSDLPNAARILRALEAVWPTQGRSFATFETDRDDPCWVQYIDGVLHLRWPHDRSPDAVFGARGMRLPRGAFSTTWQAQGTAQIAVGDVQLDVVADLVEALFADVFDVHPAETLSARVEHDR